jgi:hypothetical protein
MSYKEAEDLIEYGYLHGYGRVPKCFQIFAKNDIGAFELTLRLGQIMERKRVRKQKRKSAKLVRA